MRFARNSSYESGISRDFIKESVYYYLTRNVQANGLSRGYVKFLKSLHSFGTNVERDVFLFVTG